MARQHMRWTFNIADSEGVRAPATLYGQYDDTQLVSVLVTDLNAMKALVAAITDGQIISAEATLVAPGSAAPANFADSDVSQVGLFNFPNSAARLWGVVIPAFADAAILSGHVNLANADVEAFLLEATTTPGDFEMTDRNWLATGGLKDSFLSTRKHRRALKRASYEVPGA